MPENQSIADEIEIEILRGRCYPSQANKERSFQHLFKADRYLIALEDLIEPVRLKQLKIEYLASLRELQTAGKELNFAHGSIIRTLQQLDPSDPSYFEEKIRLAQINIYMQDNATTSKLVHSLLEDLSHQSFSPELFLALLNILCSLLIY